MACNESTVRDERPAGHSQWDERVMPSPGGRRGLAASDFAEASQERRAVRLLLRRFLVGDLEHRLPVVSLGMLGGTQIQEAWETS